MYRCYVCHYFILFKLIKTKTDPDFADCVFFPYLLYGK